MKQDMEPYKELTECPACGADHPEGSVYMDGRGPFNPFHQRASAHNDWEEHLMWQCSRCTYTYTSAIKTPNTRAQA